jgi:hypothetical protein
MYRPHRTLAVSATLTGLLLIAATSLTGISAAAADGPQVPPPSAQDLLPTLPSSPVPAYLVVACPPRAQSDQLINPPLCATDPSVDRLVGVDLAPVSVVPAGDPPAPASAMPAPAAAPAAAPASPAPSSGGPAAAPSLLSLDNVGSPTISVVVTPITQLNLAVLSSGAQANAAGVTVGGLR